MNLHADSAAFDELVEATAERKKLPQVYVEKDYWVTKALKHLASSEHFTEVVFKGGTSLSKAYRLISRFSEDIDLAVFADGISEAKRKKLLKSIETVAALGLTNIKGDVRESKGSRYRKTVYQYPRRIDAHNFGQASPQLLLEISSFTNPVPSEAKYIQTLISEVLSEENQGALIERYALQEFAINVLSAERTLVEKILGVIKDSYAEDPAARLSNRIRHLYDICLMLRKEDFRQFARSSRFDDLCTLCIEDERKGAFKDARHLYHPLRDAPLFSNFANWRATLEATYRESFSALVYGDLPDMNEIQASLEFICSGLESA